MFMITNSVLVDLLVSTVVLLKEITLQFIETVILNQGAYTVQ
jgi:hypothetical protein